MSVDLVLVNLRFFLSKSEYCGQDNKATEERGDNMMIFSPPLYSSACQV